MSHAGKADKLLIKPAAGARPAPPCRSDGSFPRHARRPVTRRVTSSTETPGWRRPQTDRPAESHSHPTEVCLRAGCASDERWKRDEEAAALIVLSQLVQ